ncbi:alpha-1,2-mannosidase [Plakobranchus ocellatus]|uniref:alpha-1,2-Mannosidase n=1 Tax=Plakobranchus ocellatus TaxID=259542 RepID=A0AAV3YF74_9GAST|nr:alpha-1,2-mannosidase [Plakobranchus ocellatus]
MGVNLNPNEARYRFVCLLVVIFVCVILIDAELGATESTDSASPMSKEEKATLREKSLEMFDHAFGAYMEHAYPADELMPLSCKGRYRGSEPSRGDIDDTLGNFTLTLIDTLDTLAVLGKLDEFDEAVQNVIKDTRFDTDVVVSVFETNIRILGGLLGGHVAAVYFKKRKLGMLWYHDELLTMAKEVGDRLLPAFNTSTGIPYARVNLLHGITPKIVNSNRDTCTSCAGTMILEFAALSRLTGIAVYEEKSRKAMDYLWGQRHRSNNLMGTVLNVHNGDWIRRESGVGAGIDSYYEYVLKTYVLLGDDTYLARFNKHYDGVMRYISQGPLLVDVHMHKPTSAARNFMDALLAFWPGLQVLVGDIGPAVETHEMLYQVVKRHNFLPEAFTTDFRVHWGQHPLRPEFVESTYFLYKATGDPYYLSVGKKVLENLEEHARVTCGFAAIKDIKRGTHEDQMDSFVLAETFKYLYLLFSEKSELLLDVEDFVFTTEAHILPLTLSVGNYSWSNPGPLNKRAVRPDIYRFDKMSVAEMAKAAEEDYAHYDEDRDDHIAGGGGVCRNYHVSISEGPGYPHRLRHRMRDMVDRAHPPSSLSQTSSSNIPRLRASEFVAANRDHLDMLRQMGIRIVTMPDGRIQLLHTGSEAASQSHAEAGLVFMQEMIELSKLSGAAGEVANQHEPMYVRILSKPFVSKKLVFRAGPAQFGYDLHTKPSVSGKLTVASPIRACTQLSNGHMVEGHIALVERGDCMFVEKARNLQRAGAIGGVVMDQAQGSSSDTFSLFAMSGDGKDDVSIPMVFLFWQQGQDMLSLLSDWPDLLVELSSSNGQNEEKDSCSNVPASSASDVSPAPPLTSSASPSSAAAAAASSSDTEGVSEPKGPGVETTSFESSERSSRSSYGFYHQDFHDLTTGQYFLQAGTRSVHLSIEVSPRQPHHTDDNSRRLKFEPLPDGSKMMTFFLRHFVRHDPSSASEVKDEDDSGPTDSSSQSQDADTALPSSTSRSLKPEKPNLNEMYLDVVHALQHGTNLELLPSASDYMKAIARFMEAAFFSLDRVDGVALEVMDQLAKEIKAKHSFPESKWANLQENELETQHESAEASVSGAEHVSPDQIQADDLKSLHNPVDSHTWKAATASTHEDHIQEPSSIAAEHSIGSDREADSHVDKQVSEQDSGSHPQASAIPHQGAHVIPECSSSSILASSSSQDSPVDEIFNPSHSSEDPRPSVSDRHAADGSVDSSEKTRAGAYDADSSIKAPSSSFSSSSSSSSLSSSFSEQPVEKHNSQETRDEL